MTTIEQAENGYRSKRGHYEGFADRIATLVTELLQARSISIAHIEHRAKTIESFVSKCRKKSYGDPLNDIRDLAGVRVVTYYHDEVQTAADLLRGEFEVDAAHSLDKLAELDVDEFGYRSLHLVCRLTASRRELIEWSKYQDMWVEIQVRSVLQHAWASISHKIDYKSASQAPNELRRGLFRLSALLELADEQFASLRDHTAALASTYQEGLASGDLDIELNLDSLTEYLRTRVDLLEWEKMGLAAGMAPLQDRENDWADSRDIGVLLEILQTLGLKRVEEVNRLIDNHRNEAPAILNEVAQAIQQEGRLFEADPVDLLSAFITLASAKQLPSNYYWGDPWFPEIPKGINRLLRKRREA